MSLSQGNLIRSRDASSKFPCRFQGIRKKHFISSIIHPCNAGDARPPSHHPLFACPSFRLLCLTNCISQVNLLSRPNYLIRPRLSTFPIAQAPNAGTQLRLVISRSRASFVGRLPPLSPWLQQRLCLSLMVMTFFLSPSTSSRPPTTSSPTLTYL